MNRPEENSYDRIPYTSFPYPQATPERIATVARMFGLAPAPPERCRVLDIGCAAGGHLLPLAEQFPHSTFLGIDLSARQIASAETARQRLALPNLRFLHHDLAALSPDAGQFDYIIAHGIFSWVAPDVQEALLANCRRLLAPTGLALISYNTYPGWHFRTITRDIMSFRAGRLADPAEKLRAGKSALDLLAKSVPEKTTYREVLDQERKQLEGKIDDYVLHEYFEDNNRPLYFHEFIARAAAHHLQFVGEAEFQTLFPLANLPHDPEAELRDIADNLIEIEQYRDFIRNRLFRHTLLCRGELAVERFLPASRMAGIYVASKLKPDTPDASPAGDAPLTFTGGDISTTSADPLYKAAMLHLAAIYPAAEKFETLYARAAERLGLTPAPNPLQSPDGRTLAVSFLRGYSMAAVELSVARPRFTLTIADRPVAPRFARLMASAGELATNLRHESYRPSHFERHLLQLLDGTRDRPALAAAVHDLVAKGELRFLRDGQPLTDPGDLARQIEQGIHDALDRLARRAFLLAG
jgi:methyltransferase-like protein/cyclopropane fatty-acyl-phospholipid synthase-like methyltransferase